MKKAGLIVMAVLFAGGILNFSYGCVGVFEAGPKLLTYYYLYAIKVAYGIDSFRGYHGGRKFYPPSDARTRITTPEVFKEILNEVANTFSGKIWSFERVIAEVNAELYNKRDEIKDQIGFEIIGEGEKNEIRAKLEKCLESHLGSEIDALLQKLGVDGDKQVSMERLGVYPVVSDPALCLATGDRFNEPYETHTINTTIRGLVMDWVIENWLAGLDPAITSNILDTINYLLDENPDLGDGKTFSKPFRDAIAYYLGKDKLHPDNPEDLMALLNIGREISLGGVYTPWDLVTIMGLEKLVDQVEAYFNQEFYTPPIEKDQDEPAANKEIAEKIFEFTGMKIYITRRILNLLNETNYFGRQLSLNNPYDAGIVGSFVDRFYGVLREANYNPTPNLPPDQRWKKKGKMTIEDALGLVEAYIKIAKDIKPYLEKVYGRIPLLERGYQAEKQRGILAQWTEAGYRFVKYGGMSPEEAVEAIRQLLPGGDKSSRIIDLIAKMWVGFGDKTEQQVRGAYSKSADEWLEEEVNQYNGMVSTLYDVPMKYSKMFGLADNVDLKTAIDAVDEMLTVANEAKLPQLVKEYLGVEGWYNLGRGERSGKYMFWAQVLYSLYKQTGDLQKATDYVYLQLKARQLVREKSRIEPAKSLDRWNGFNAIENVLEGDLSNLRNVADTVSRIKDPVGLSDLGRLLEPFSSETKTRLWPATPDEADSFSFPLISEDAVQLLVEEKLVTPEEVERYRSEGLIASSSAELSPPQEETGFATVPPQEPVAEVDVPLL